MDGVLRIKAESIEDGAKRWPKSVTALFRRHIMRAKGDVIGLWAGLDSGACPLSDDNKRTTTKPNLEN